MGWNKPTGVAPTAPKKKPNVFRGLLAGLVVVALAAIAYFTFLGGNATAPETKAEKKPAAIKEVAPAKLQRTNDAPVVAAKPEVTKENYDKGLGDDWETIQRVKKEGGQYRDAQGKRHRVKVSKSIFHHSTDSMLCMLLCAGTQEIMLPPMDGDGTKEFLKSLETPIIINPDDSEDVKQKKLMVRAARKQVKDMIDQGRTFSEVVAEHRKDMDFQRQTRLEAIKGLHEYTDKGDTEGAQIYLEAINPTLKNMGLDEIHMPTGEKGPRKRKVEEK